MVEHGDRPLVAEDELARRRALDVSTSFIVQAPAGSGKTELLIQRYLALLARVDEPERIVALTFTRKAAGEMRERVLGALVAAARGDAVADEPHARLTRELAGAALVQSRRRGWTIADHPARLRVQTFDALATALARRGPIAAGLGPRPAYLDDARPLFRRAAEEALLAAGADDASWTTLLAHLDNQAEQAVRLVAEMLERRDQWLRQLSDASNAALRAGLEQALRAEIAEVLERTRRAFPGGVADDIARCAAHAAAALAEGDEACARDLHALARAGGLPSARVEAQPLWRTLARFLLVKDGSHFKRMVTRNDGFPPAGKPPGSVERRERKEAMQSLCLMLDSVPGLADALHAAGGLPLPQTDDGAWHVVESLLDVLRRAAAQLVTVFASSGNVDFVQANLAALSALGDDKAPSDVLLQLDASVQHLLVDEFQDTSYVQLRLLKTLTSGWSAGDGRTLFAVGDPMQSIYRFREAEVAFFLEARETGRINDVPVEPLTLRRNFRSQANLVDWCNAVFSRVLGEIVDPARGAVRFEAAAAKHPPLEGVRPELDLCENATDEARLVVRRIREAQAAGAGDIAVLVRARAHLVELLPALRREGIPFVAVELDKLSQRQAVLDLAALTHALVQPCDRVAWLALLRAPWCGLALADLGAVAQAAGPDRAIAIPSIVLRAGPLPGVSQDGMRRLDRVRAVLEQALRSRGQTRLVERVRGAWLALGGPALVDDPLDLDTARAYFDLLAAHERAGDVADWDAFVGALDLLLATPAASPSGGVQVMTMHKAKGLEFDTVIATGLAQPPNYGDAPLMRWRRRDEGLLIAPAKARGAEADPLYRYLRDLEAEQDAAELGRLLYVACTRAKTRLFLVGAPGTEVDRGSGALGWKDAPKGSSLDKLSRAVELPLPLFADAANDASASQPEAPPLRRLPVDAALPDPDEALDIDVTTPSREIVPPPFDWARETTRHIGTIAHRLLARLAERGRDGWTTDAIEAFAPRVRADLVAAGFASDELASAVERVLEAVRRTLADPRGRWLFDAGHEEARSEWAIAGIDDGAIVHVVLDRTFVSEGTRWIVDFKTGAHEGGDAAAFLDREVERYRDQLARYGRIASGLDARPIRLALYYPLVDGGFREVVAT
jgi:ATP-dependent exoDNAse (exonuclease V) beta subunit